MDAAFATEIDHATLSEWCGAEPNERCYSPPVVVSAIKKVITGDPDHAHISTSYVECQNWTLRGTMPLYTRLSNGFSRKVENHMATVALNYFFYNFIKIHMTLRTSPAMAAGVTKRLFDVSDLVALLIEARKMRPSRWSLQSEAGLEAKMAIRMLVRIAIAMTLLIGAPGSRAAVAQAPATPDTTRLMGTWAGDKKANDKPFQAGLISMEFGLKISTVNDALVVDTISKRPPAAPGDPWIQGDTLSYKLDGSASPTVFNGRSARTTLVKDGDALVLTVLEVPARAGGGGAGPPPPPLGNVLRTLRMSVDGDRLKVEWNAAGFASTLYFDREKPRSAQ